MRLTSTDSLLTNGAAPNNDTAKSSCSCAKKTSWTDAYDGDSTAQCATAATKKLRCAGIEQDAAATEAKEDLECSSRGLRPTGAPADLFDFHMEAQEIRKNFSKDTKKRLQQLKDRAKATKFFYQDKETLMLAVDLYNCSNKVYVRDGYLECCRHTQRVGPQEVTVRSR
jgi:hypothetical protein